MFPENDIQIYEKEVAIDTPPEQYKNGKVENALTWSSKFIVEPDVPQTK